MTNTVAVEIGALAGLDVTSLRDRWRALYGATPPIRMSRELLTQAIAYRMQEQAYGGLAPAVVAKLNAVGPERDGARARVERKAKPGTRFLREWQGRTHEAVATEDGGFIYRGTAYRSLSAIAREITGTNWSGPKFFGLTWGTNNVAR